VILKEEASRVCHCLLAFQKLEKGYSLLFLNIRIKEFIEIYINKNLTFKLYHIILNSSSMQIWLENHYCCFFFSHFLHVISFLAHEMVPVINSHSSPLDQSIYMQNPNNIRIAGSFWCVFNVNEINKLKIYLSSVIFR
jgi:hypothetical protein